MSGTVTASVIAEIQSVAPTATMTVTGTMTASTS
jgi:hypothetical protein